MSTTEKDHFKGLHDLKEWMGLALEKAEDSLRKAEVPVGCLFIYENEVIASGNNTVNETRNATRHAEINCIDKVLEYCKERQLDYHEVFKKIDVVVTVEPCIMCAAALHQLHIRSIVYGCPNDRFGGCTSVFEVPKISDAVIDITSNVRAEEAMILLKNFYKGTNPNAPECKVKKKKPFVNIAQKTDGKEDNKNAESGEQQNENSDKYKEEASKQIKQTDKQNEEIDNRNKQDNKQNEVKQEIEKDNKPSADVMLKNQENVKKSQGEDLQMQNESDVKNEVSVKQSTRSRRNRHRSKQTDSVNQL